MQIKAVNANYIIEIACIIDMTPVHNTMIRDEDKVTQVKLLVALEILIDLHSLFILS